MSEEETIKNLALKIASDYNKTVKQRTDNLLELNAIMYTNVGIDSTKIERTKVKSDSRFIYNEIKKMDSNLGKEFISNMDK